MVEEQNANAFTNHEQKQQNYVAMNKLLFCQRLWGPERLSTPCVLDSIRPSSIILQPSSQPFSCPSFCKRLVILVTNGCIGNLTSSSALGHQSLQDHGRLPFQPSSSLCSFCCYLISSVMECKHWIDERLLWVSRF